VRSAVRGAPKAAAPHNEANGDVDMRPWRISTSSGSRVRSCSPSRATGIVAHLELGDPAGAPDLDATPAGAAVTDPIGGALADGEAEQRPTLRLSGAGAPRHGRRFGG
jgi:hypothetical protein